MHGAPGQAAYARGPVAATRNAPAWGVMPSRWTLVTDESADPVAMQAFRDNGVEVVIAPRRD